MSRFARSAVQTLQGCTSSCLQPHDVVAMYEAYGGLRLVRAVKNVCFSSLIPCDRYPQGCIKQSPGRLHGSLDVDDGKDVCARTWGFGTGVAADAADGNAPGESDACRGVCDGTMAPGVGYRGIGHPCTCRYSKTLAMGSRAQRFGLRMRWLAGTGASWAFWRISKVSCLQPQRQ